MFSQRMSLLVCLVGTASWVLTGGVASAAVTTDAGPSPGASRANGSANSVSEAGVPRGPVLDRSAFVRAVLRRNPSIESARDAWRAASARVREAGTLEDPELDLGIAPLSIGSSSARVGYEVGLSQRLPWPGKRGLAASAAAAEAAAAKHDLEAARRDLALAAVGLYDDYFVAARSLEINAEHVALLGTLQQSATARFESGRGAAMDALQAKSELAHMEHDRVVLESERDVVVAQMNELLHRDPSEPLPPPPGDLPLETARVGADVRQLLTYASSKRPEIAAMQQRARGEQLRADRARREYYPDFTVSASYDSMWDMPEHRWMVGLGVNLPIWTSARAGAEDEATALHAEFESEVSRLESAARTQTYIAWKRVQVQEHVLGVFEGQLLPVARAQVEAARAGFVTSQSSFTAVLDAERNLRQAELDYQVARADCDRRQAELERALGRIPGFGGKDGGQ